jgi:hypothetical protein
MIKRRRQRREEQGSTTASCSSSSTTTTTTSGTLKSPLKNLKRFLKPSPSSEEKIDAARRKASERLKPKPFSRSKVDRLTELKAVKAESSALSSGNENDGLQQEKQSASTERDYGMTRHGIILSCSLVVYTMIRMLPLSKTMIQTSAYQTFIDMCSILLQASSLRSLLYIFSLLAFDAIKIGRSGAFIKGRELFISQVSKCTYLISMAIVLASLVIVVATMFFQKVACFMIRGESGEEMQSPQLFVRTANLGRVEDASMGAVLEYLMRYATIVLDVLANVDRLLPPLLGLGNFFGSACEKALQMPSPLSSHLVHQTLSVCTYFTTRFAVFCVAAFGIAQVLLPKSR